MCNKYGRYNCIRQQRNLQRQNICLAATASIRLDYIHSKHQQTTVYTNKRRKNILVHDITYTTYTRQSFIDRTVTQSSMPEHLVTEVKSKPMTPQYFINKCTADTTKLTWIPSIATVCQMPFKYQPRHQRW